MLELLMNRHGRILSSLILAAASLAALCSCAGTGTRDSTSSHLRERFYGSLVFDSRGMPSFSEELSKRPDEKGADFFLVEEDTEGRPLKYYHISVKGDKTDMVRPFRTLLERTASGIKGGATFAIEFLKSNPAAGSDEEAAAVLTFAALSVVIGTAGGITVGLVEGTYEAVLEAGKSFSSFEDLLSFSHCVYDDMGRLEILRAFEQGPPGEPTIELFRVKYSYEGGSSVPISITVEDVSRH
jgi:hypothetical protein